MPDKPTATAPKEHANPGPSSAVGETCELPTLGEMEQALEKVIETPLDPPSDPTVPWEEEASSDDGCAEDGRELEFSSESDDQPESVESDRDTDDDAVAAVEVSARMHGAPRVKLPDDRLFRNSLTGAIHRGQATSSEYLFCSRYIAVHFAELPTGAVFQENKKCKDCYGLRRARVASRESSSTSDYSES